MSTLKFLVREIEEKTNTAFRNAGLWLDEAGLILAAYKTEAVLISGQKILKKMEVTVGGTTIESKKAIKYLGVVVDVRLNFREHMKYIIGHYNPSVRIINPISHTTYIVCVTFLYISGDTYCLKSTPNKKFFEKLFMAILFLLPEFLPEIC